MTGAWRIDSIDARAGLAFASWRTSDLDLDVLDLGKPAVFLSPPFFRAEALTSRAIGFSAARGRAQLGVFVGGAELAFESLEDLTEFVRRAYIGGGSGDAGGGGGGGGPPPAPDEPTPEVPEGGLGIAEEEVFQHPVVMAAKAAASAAANLAFEAGWPVKTQSLEIGGTEAETIAKTTSPLVDGATEVLLELLRRFPAKLELDAIETWSRSAQSLGGAITRLELWEDIMGGPYGGQLERLVRTMLPQAGEIPPNRNALPALFGATSIEHISLFRDGSYYYDLMASNWTRWNDGDPIDQIALWPLPTDIKPLAISNQDDPSAFGLMCAINANPAILADRFPLPAVRAWSILHFAAAHLLAESQPPLRGSWLLPMTTNGAREAITRLSGTWLFQQWPKIVFPQPVELAIQEASALSP